MHLLEKCYDDDRYYSSKLHFLSLSQMQYKINGKPKNMRNEHETRIK
jgi:hypothetical protein